MKRRVRAYGQVDSVTVKVAKAANGWPPWPPCRPGYRAGAPTQAIIARQPFSGPNSLAFAVVFRRRWPLSGRSPISRKSNLIWRE